jgi:hypothetical protein
MTLVSELSTDICAKCASSTLHKKGVCLHCGAAPTKHNKRNAAVKRLLTGAGGRADGDRHARGRLTPAEQGAEVLGAGARRLLAEEPAP